MLWLGLVREFLATNYELIVVVFSIRDQGSS
jgi:hypothetical protein